MIKRGEIVIGDEIAFIISISLSMLAGFLVGAERESRGKDAGISTHSLVIVGSMIFTFLSMRVDPMSQSRIAAQIVSGIGFLGAGIILKDKDYIKNLTTAASLWYAGGIGMAFGFGYHIVGLIATAVAIILPRIPRIK